MSGTDLRIFHCLQHLIFTSNPWFAENNWTGAQMQWTRRVPHSVSFEETHKPLWHWICKIFVCSASCLYIISPFSSPFSLTAPWNPKHTHTHTRPKPTPLNEHPIPAFLGKEKMLLFSGRFSERFSGDSHFRSKVPKNSYPVAPTCTMAWGETFQLFVTVTVFLFGLSRDIL